MGRSRTAAQAASRDAGADWLPALGPYECFGASWRLLTTDPRAAALLDELYAPMRTPAPAAPLPLPTTFRFQVEAAGGRGSVQRDETPVASGPNHALLLERLVWAVNRHVIDGALDRLLMHAGAVLVDGAVVVLPAVMEAGKTTLVTGLLDRGAAYLTDEAASIGDDLQVEGYAKPLSIDRGSWDVLAHHEPLRPPEFVSPSQWQVPPASFAPVVREGPLGLVVFPSYRDGAATELHRLRSVDAVERAVPCTFAPTGETVPTRKVRQLAAALSAVPCYSLVSGVLDEACAAVLDVAARHRGDAPSDSRPAGSS